MAKVKLKDGRVVDIPMDPSWDKAAQQRAIREYKANPDPSETDPLGTYAAKEAGSIARGGGGGIASTLDFLGNTVAVGPRVAYNWWNDKPLLTGFGGDAIRDTYESVVPAQPRGSDYETTAAVSEIAVPALAETLLTGSPKTAPVRAGRDVGLGLLGGWGGEEAGKRLGGSEEAGELGRIIGSMVTPAVGGSRTGAKAATIKTGLPILSTMLSKLGLGRLDPYKLIPASTPADVAKRALVGGSASSAFDYEEDR